MSLFHSRRLALPVRAGLSALVLVIALGLVASLAHLEHHYAPRDQASGLTLLDLQGAYHGVDRPAPLAAALERGHPEGLGERERAALVAWLAGDRLAERYDDPDLGADAPAEILERACIACHARRPADGATPASPALEYWDDVEREAFALAIPPTPPEIVMASAHAHALALAPLSLVLAALVLATRAPGWLKSGLVLVFGLALLADLASWFLAREHLVFVHLIVAAGSAYTASTALACALVLADLWWPLRREVGER